MLTKFIDTLDYINHSKYIQYVSKVTFYLEAEYIELDFDNICDAAVFYEEHVADYYHGMDYDTSRNSYLIKMFVGEY